MSKQSPPFFKKKKSRMKMEKGDRKTKRHGKLLYRFNLNFLYEVKSSELLFVFVVVFCFCITYIIYEITEETDKLKLKQF